MSYTKGVKVINDLNDVDTVTTVPTNGDFLVFNGTNWVPNNVLPTAKITRTSKISNRLTVNASASSSILAGDTLIYAWTISPAVGVTISTPAAVSTNIICPTGSAEYTLTLTVTSTLSGLSATDTYEFKTDFIIDVRGVDEEHNDIFLTLASAYAWIAANDAANVANYQINILGTTLDAARITPPGAARVHWADEGRVNVGFDLTVVGTYTFSADGDNAHIVSVAGTCFTLAAGVALLLNGVVAVATASNTISCANAGTIILRRAQLGCQGAGFACINATNSTITIQHSFISNTTTGNNIIAAGGTLEIQHSYLQGTGTNANVQASNSNLAIYFNRFLNRGAIGVTPFNLNLTNAPGIVNGNEFQIIPAVAVTCKNVYIFSAAITGPVTFTHNHLIQSGGNNGTNSTCLMIEGASAQPIHMANNTIDILSTNPAMITVQTANNAAWRFINNALTNQSGGASLSSSTTNGAIVPVALVNLNYFNNVWNGALNGPIAFNAGVALGSANHQY